MFWRSMSGVPDETHAQQPDVTGAPTAKQHSLLVIAKKARVYEPGCLLGFGGCE